MGDQFIFVMHKLRKIAGSKEILRGISLAFFPGAKIGIVGENGSGKTTVLRIMAVLETDFVGDAGITPGFRAGMVAQEPVHAPVLLCENDSEVVTRQGVGVGPEMIDRLLATDQGRKEYWERLEVRGAAESMIA